MTYHKICAEVPEDLFRFYQDLLPYGEKGRLIPKILSDLRTIYKADPLVIKKYLEDKITILDLKEEITNGNR